MMRFFVLPIIASSILALMYLGYRAWIVLQAVDYVYIRFRGGILTIRRTSRFGEDEDFDFAPGPEFEMFTAPQLAGMADKIAWFAHPSGHRVENEVTRESIARTLRYAHNTKLLDAEIETRPPV